MNDLHALQADGHLLEDYAALEYILLGDLRDLLEEPADDENRRWLAAILDALLETQKRGFELQEAGGYLSEVLEQFPNWDSQVDLLHEEQHMLFGKLRQLRERIGLQVSFSGIANEVRYGLRDWMALLNAHHRHTRRILQSAFNLDVGVGD